MALELYPTPCWPRPLFSVPLAIEQNKHPALTEMASQPLKQLRGAPGEVLSYWASDCRSLFFVVELDQVGGKAGQDSFVFSVARQTETLSSCCCTTLAFSAIGAKAQIDAMERLGVSLPPSEYSKIRLKVTGEGKKYLVSVGIPWSLLPPLRPLLYETIACNLSVVRNYPSQEQSLFQLVEDPGYGRTDAGLLRLLAVGITPKPSQTPVAQSFLTHNLWQGKKPLKINLGLYNPKTCPAKLETTIKKGGDTLEAHSSTVELGTGPHRWTLHWSPQRPLASGEYTIEIGGHGCGKTYLKKHPFFVIDPAELDALQTELMHLEENVNCLYPLAVQTALATLERMEQKQAICTWDKTAYQDFLRVREMRDALVRGANPIENKPGLSSRSFRSPKDGALHAYSLYLPKNFNSGRKWPLLMLLSPGGSKQPLPGFAALSRQADRLGLVLVQPQIPLGSIPHRSDGAEITQTLATIKQSLPLDWDKLFLAGLGAGGFSAWSVGLKHPEHFSGLALIGCAELPANFSAGLADFSATLLKMPLLLIGGAEAEALAASLTAKGAKLTSKIGAGSADNWLPKLASWLRALLK